jgi:hypothetical protein
MKQSTPQNHILEIPIYQTPTKKSIPPHAPNQASAVHRPRPIQIGKADQFPYPEKDLISPSTFLLQFHTNPSPKAKRWGGAGGEAGSSAAPSALKLALTLPLQAANKNPPRSKTTKPALPATPNSRRQSEKSEVPHQPRAPARGYQRTAPSARTQNSNRKAKPTDFPFSMAFEISDKKAMEKGQGMRR